METYKTMQVYVDEDIEFRLERGEGVFLIHATANNNKLSTLKKGKKILKEMLTLAEFYGVDEMYTYTKDPKFVQLSGNAIYDDTIDVQGETFEVYRWELQPQ